MLRWRVMGLMLLAGMFSAAPAHAVVVNGSPDGNTADPGNYGWAYVGSWSGVHGNGSGVAIAPNAFLTAHHIGGTDADVFTLNGTSYDVIANGVTNIAGTDLDVVTVNGTFSSYAHLATSLSGTPQVSLVGYGSHSYDDQNPVVTGGTANGWINDLAGTKSWGLNNIEELNASASNGDSTHDHLIRIDFDNATGEAILAPGDSGGGTFVNQDGQWELAGVNFGISQQLYQSDGAGGYIKLSDVHGDGASIYDTTGLYVKTGDNSYSLATDLPYNLQQEQAYATNITAYRDDILSLVTIPEPASLLLFTPMALLLIRRRRAVAKSAV